MAALVQRDLYHFPRLVDRELSIWLTLGPSLRWRNVAQSLPARRSEQPRNCFIRLDVSEGLRVKEQHRVSTALKEHPKARLILEWPFFRLLASSYFMRH